MLPRKRCCNCSKRVHLKLGLLMGFSSLFLFIYTLLHGLQPASFLNNPALKNGSANSHNDGTDEYYATCSPILIGKLPSHTGFLTIGISSVYREEDYLIKTLHSIIDKSSITERNNVTIVVGLSDTNASIRARISLNITQLFRPYILSGFLIVIHIPSNYVYPSFLHLRQTFNDSSRRVAWRAKQAIDFAHLFHFCRNISQFYMILEDDVDCVQGYLGQIKSQINILKGHRWLTLHFSNFLIIGTVFHSSYLAGLSDFVRLFYAIQPVDYLIRHYFEMLIPGEDKDNYFHYLPTLFQHIGYYSTLHDKIQPLTDSTFPGDVPGLYISNPAATVFTTIHTFKYYKPDLAYSSNVSFFWGIPQQGDTYDIVFNRPIRVANVNIVTGLPGRPDYLKHGLLLSSPQFINLSAPNRAHCSRFEAIGKFVEGKVNTTQFSSPVQCLRILITQQQKQWLIIRKIAVFTIS